RPPRITLYRKPGRSLTRPPRMRTTECSWRLCPSPGMYAVTSIWFVRRTRATLRRAEFGFFGVTVYTRVQTPRFWGAPRRAGVLVLPTTFWRWCRTSWLIVGIRCESSRRPRADREGPPGAAATANTSTGSPFPTTVLYPLWHALPGLFEREPRGASLLRQLRGRAGG